VADFQDSIHDHPNDGFQESFLDHSLFVRTSPSRRVLLLFFYLWRKRATQSIYW